METDPLELNDLPTLRQPAAGPERVYHLEDPGAYRSLCEQLFAAGYDFPQCLSGIDMDYGLRNVLHLRRLKDLSEVTVWLDVPYDKPTVPSVSDLWGGLEWHEREAYDLLGLRYEGHPDLRRILLEDHWTIHPLQRRYDTGGYLIPSWQAKAWPDWEAIAREKEEAAQREAEAAQKRAEAAKAKAAAPKGEGEEKPARPAGERPARRPKEEAAPTEAQASADAPAVKPEEVSPREAQPEEVAAREAQPEEVAPQTAQPDEVSIQAAQPEEATSQTAQPEEVTPQTAHPEESPSQAAQPEEVSTEATPVPEVPPADAQAQADAEAATAGIEAEVEIEVAPKARADVVAEVAAAPEADAVADAASSALTEAGTDEVAAGLEATPETTAETTSPLPETLVEEETLEPTPESKAAAPLDDASNHNVTLSVSEGSAHAKAEAEEILRSLVGDNEMVTSDPVASSEGETLEPSPDTAEVSPTEAEAPETIPTAETDLAPQANEVLEPTPEPSEDEEASANEETLKTPPPSNEPPPKDDLTVIKGIGEKIAEQLYSVGITSYAQIAALTDKEAAVLAERLKLVPRNRLKKYGWRKQARALLKGKQ